MAQYPVREVVNYLAIAHRHINKQIFMQTSLSRTSSKTSINPGFLLWLIHSFGTLSAWTDRNDWSDVFSSFRIVGFEILPWLISSADFNKSTWKIYFSKGSAHDYYSQHNRSFYLWSTSTLSAADCVAASTANQRIDVSLSWQVITGLGFEIGEFLVV